MGSMLPYTAAPWILWDIYIYIYYLVGGFNRLEKYEFVNGKDYPIILSYNLPSGYLAVCYGSHGPFSEK